MVDSIVEFIKVFCEKIFFWLVLSTITVSALFNQCFMKWLGFECDKRWKIGVVATIAVSLSIQHIFDLANKYYKRHCIIKNIENLPDSAKRELEVIIKNRKKTLKLKIKDNIEQQRIVEHFCLERHNNYVIFPDYLWKILIKKFENKNSITCRK